MKQLINSPNCKAKDKCKGLILFFAIIFSFLLFLPLINANQEENLVISLILNYDNGTLTDLETSIIETQYPLDKPTTSGNYSLKVFSFLNEELYQDYFDFDLRIFDAEMLDLEQTDKIIFMPYFKTGKSVNIYKGDKEILNIDISSFAVCNQNKICDNHESEDRCPEDCKSNQEKIIKDNTERNSLELTDYMLYILVGFVVLIIIWEIVKRKPA